MKDKMKIILFFLLLSTFYLFPQNLNKLEIIDATANFAIKEGESDYGWCPLLKFNIMNNSSQDYSSLSLRVYFYDSKNTLVDDQLEYISILPAKTKRGPVIIKSVFGYNLDFDRIFAFMYLFPKEKWRFEIKIKNKKGIYEKIGSGIVDIPPSYKNKLDKEK